MSTEQSVDPELVEQTKQQIRNLVREIAQLSKSELEPTEFYDAVLNRLVTALAAVGGAVWTFNDNGQLDLEYQINLLETKLAENREGQIRHSRLLRKVMTSGEGMLVAPQSGSGNDEDGGNPTDFLLVLGPLKADQETHGIIEIFQRPGGSTNVQRGYLRFLLQMCELAGDYLKTRKLRQISDRQSLWSQLEQFTRMTHRSLDPRSTAYTVANEGRRLIECDRVSVGICKGRRCVIEAISGQDTFDKRSNTVTLLGELATAVTATGDPVWYTGDTSNMAPQVEEAVQAYVDESHSKTVAIIPLKKPREATEENKHLPHEVIGALIVEQIEDSRVREGLPQRVEVVSEHSSLALSNALEYNNLFLMPLWRAIGKSKVLVSARHLPKTIAASIALLVLLAFLIFFPWDLELTGKGKLQPVHRREVFAGINGQVEEVLVEQGAFVEEGTPLVKLKNLELTRELIRVQGDLTASIKQRNSTILQLQDEQRRGAKAQATELAGKAAELTATIASLEGQLATLKRKEALLTVLSPITGQITTWQPDDLLKNRPVQEGQVLLSVAEPRGEWELEVHMPEETMGHVNTARRNPDIGQNLPVRFYVATDPGTQHQGTVREVHSSADVRGEEGNTVLLKVSIDRSVVYGDQDRAEEILKNPKINAGVTAHVYCGRTSVGYAYLHTLVTWFQKMWFRLW
jgi:hypothetical protein